jgi:hypothetical protein
MPSTTVRIRTLILKNGSLSIILHVTIKASAQRLMAAHVSLTIQCVKVTVVVKTSV